VLSQLSEFYHAGVLKSEPERSAKGLGDRFGSVRELKTVIQRTQDGKDVMGRMGKISASTPLTK
jgi:hypothetical protein